MEAQTLEIGLWKPTDPLAPAGLFELDQRLGRLEKIDAQLP